MHPLQAAAQFAAYVWYTETNPQADLTDAAWFSRTNWSEFLPGVNEGLGRLLLKIADRESPRRKAKLPLRMAVSH